MESVPVVAAQPPTSALVELADKPVVRWWRRRSARRWIIFAATVVLPTMTAAVYYGLVASDQYISESRFVVRNPQRASTSGIGSLLQGTVFSKSQDDTYSVHDYIQSRDALLELDRQLDLRRHFGGGAVDALNRFPGPDGDASFEALHRYYEKHLVIEFDTVSGITALKVRAFDAKTAYAINEQLLHMGERLVNNLNERSRRDLIQVAEKEVGQAETRVKTAAAALTTFRTKNGVFDPALQFGVQSASAQKLQEELVSAQAQLAALRRVAPANPQVESLSAHVQTLQKAIAEEQGRLLGGEKSLSAKAPGYERLQLEKTFADRQLTTALGALDSARNEASRKQLYLERLVQPNLPDVAVEPRRARAVATVFVVGLLLWGIVSLIVASVREHAD